MITWKLVPKIESVSKYVECYWFLAKEPHDNSNIYPKLNPDPSAHLIIATDSRVYHYAHNAISHDVQGSHWIFPHLNTFTMDHSSPFTVVGIKFRIGALYSLNFHDVVSRLDSVESVDTNQLFGGEPFNTEQLLIDAFEHKNQVASVLDQTLSAWLLNSHEDKHSDLVRQILQRLSDTAISKIGQKLHRSQRTIERSFRRVTGLTMKQAHSMIRLEEILHYLYQLDDGDINWADVASKYDFCDQPHLIRDLKNTIGTTPAEYAQQRDLTIDIYGNFEFN